MNDCSLVAIWNPDAEDWQISAVVLCAERTGTDALWPHTTNELARAERIERATSQRRWQNDIFDISVIQADGRTDRLGRRDGSTVVRRQNEMISSGRGQSSPRQCGAALSPEACMATSPPPPPPPPLPLLWQLRNPDTQAEAASSTGNYSRRLRHRGRGGGTGARPPTLIHLARQHHSADIVEDRDQDDDDQAHHNA